MTSKSYLYPDISDHTLYLNYRLTTIKHRRNIGICFGKHVVFFYTFKANYRIFNFTNINPFIFLFFIFSKKKAAA